MDTIGRDGGGGHCWEQLPQMDTIGRDGGGGHCWEQLPQVQVQARQPVVHHETVQVDSAGSTSTEDTGGSTNSADEIVHFDWAPGQLLSTRYEMRRLLGDGTFGRCLSAYDKQAMRPVAIKVIRDVQKYVRNAKVEAAILEEIRKVEPAGGHGLSIMYETFMHEDRFFCIVLEPLGQSLYDFLKGNSFRGFYLEDVQSFASQCMKALAFMHDTMQLTHTDLKPENILLVSSEPPQRAGFMREALWQRARQSQGQDTRSLGPYLRPADSRIKLIDFGNATYRSEHHSSIINTRQYRSPEVIFEMKWNELSDIWSIGCILMELFTGEQLFETHQEIEHLALMERIIGPFPHMMLSKVSPRSRQEYLQDENDGGWRIGWPGKASRSSREHVSNQQPLLQQAPPKFRPFLCYISELIRLDPAQRLSAAQAASHEFLRLRLEE